MSPNRREFLWTMGSAAAVLSVQQLEDLYWAAPTGPDLGWAPGIEERLNSACLICPARCGVEGRLVDGRLVRLKGHAFHPMSRGGLCPRGVAGPQLLYHPERLRSPLIREGERGAGAWRSVSREEAITHITERLQLLQDEQRTEELALLTGYCAGSMADIWHSSPGIVPVPWPTSGIGSFRPSDRPIT